MLAAIISGQARVYLHVNWSCRHNQSKLLFSPLFRPIGVLNSESLLSLKPLMRRVK